MTFLTSIEYANYLSIAALVSIDSSLCGVSFFEGESGTSVDNTDLLLAEYELSSDDGDTEHFHDG